MPELAEQPHHVRPVVVLMIAILSVGGLLFLGWQAKLANNITGNAFADSYVACCSTQEWRTGSTGLFQGVTATRSVACAGNELKESCCLRDGGMRSKYPVRLVGAVEGYCSRDRPKVEYPAQVPRGQRYDACCSVQEWKHSTSGFYQGVAQTFTGYCDVYETASQCCVRAGEEYTGSSVRLIGARLGGCARPIPQMSYPVWVR
ncbi:hypothetical protein C4580_01560 [Candidatus Woesearchaeota archaeon]|nr:MAG: hypothetical protein C4580_01560 [Candidatus Woesearchaeota archaeon]